MAARKAAQSLLPLGRGLSFARALAASGGSCSATGSSGGVIGSSGNVQGRLSPSAVECCGMRCHPLGSCAHSAPAAGSAATAPAAAATAAAAAAAAASGAVTPTSVSIPTLQISPALPSPTPPPPSLSTLASTIHRRHVSYSTHLHAAAAAAAEGQQQSGSDAAGSAEQGSRGGEGDGDADSAGGVSEALDAVAEAMLEPPILVGSASSASSPAGEGEEGEGEEADVATTRVFRSIPWVFTMTEVPPDASASLLSDKAKEAIYSLHRDDPERWTAERLASEFRIRQQRVHAVLWLKQREREAEAAQGGKPLDGEINDMVEQVYGTVEKAACERHVKMYPSAEVEDMEEGEERMRRLLEESDEEELWKVKQFVRRMNFNRKQMAGLMKVNKLDRRRPPEGWSYLVEELGADGRRGRGGGRRYVVEPSGLKRELNELEKDFLLRETVQRRRRIVPR